MKTYGALTEVAARGGTVSGRDEWRQLATAAGLSWPAMNSCFGTRSPSMTPAA
jgi:hypothetical protein